MTSPEREHLRYTQHEVVDDHHVKVGKITDVIYDMASESPRWAIIKMHAFGREHVAPLEGSYLADDGRVVLPHAKATVKDAPIVPHDHVLTHELEEMATRHYGLAA